MTPDDWNSIESLNRNTLLPTFSKVRIIDYLTKEFSNEQKYVKRGCGEFSIQPSHLNLIEDNFLCSLRQDAVLPPDDIRKEVCELISSISNTTYEDCHKNTQNFYEEIEKYKDCCLGVRTYLVDSSLPFNVDKKWKYFINPSHEQMFL